MPRVSGGSGHDFEALRALVEEQASEDLARLERLTASFTSAAPAEAAPVARAASVSARGPVASAAARKKLTKERIASHFNPSTRHDKEGGRDRHARVKPGTLLRDQNGNPMYNGNVPSAQQISIASTGLLTVQRHPVIRDAQGNLMVYL